VSKVISPLLGVFGMVASFIPGGQPVALALTTARMGVEYVSSKNGKKRGGDQPISIQSPPPTYKVTVDHPIVPRIISYGRVQNPGVSFWKEAGPAKTSLTYGFYMCDGPITGIDIITCDDESVDWLDFSTNMGPVPTTTIWGPNTSSMKWVQWSGVGPVVGPLTFVEVQNATAAGAQSYLLSKFQPSGSYFGISIADAGMLNYWDDQHLGKGCTCFYAWAWFPALYNGADRQKYYPNNWPMYNFVYRGAPLYDPRDPGQTEHENGEYSIYNTTWMWSENPALIAADYVNRMIHNGTTAIRGINWASIAEAADDCDRLVACFIRNFGNGGICYEPFARMSANVSLDLEPRDVLAKIMAVCDGSYGIDQNGLFNMWIGKAETANVTFTDADISAVQQDFGLPLSEETNYIHITYTEPRQRYSPIEAPIYQDAESVAKIGRRTEDIQLEYCPSPSQAWRMVRRYIKRRNRRRRLVVRLGARGILAAGQRYVALNSAMLDLIGTFRVLSISQGESLAEWNAELIEVHEDIYVDELPPPDPVKNFEVVKAPTLPTPVARLSVVYDDTNDGYAVRIDYAQRTAIGGVPGYGGGTAINFDYLVVDPNLMWDARYSTDGGTTWKQVNVLISQFTVQTPVLAQGTTVTVQARWIPNNGTPGNWGSSVSITI
jgi:hypothetical protein